MNISRVKLTQGGLKGMVITYSKEEIREGAAYINYHDVEHQAPVPLKIRKLFQKGQQFFCDICKLDKSMKDPGALRITVIDGSEGRMRLTAKVMSIDQIEYEAKSPWMESGSIYSKYNEMCLWLEECYRMAQEYVEKPIVESAAQYLLDFQATEKGKKFLGEDFDAEALTPAEQNAKYIEALEAQGMIVLGKEELAAGEAPADDVAVPNEKKMKVA